MADQAQDMDDEDDVIAQINIIPFVDICLVLLIIFLCTSSVIAKAAFQVDLPKAAAAGEAVDSTANIVLTAAGEIFLNGAAVTPQALKDQVAQQARANPHLRAVIAADKAVRYDQLILAVDLTRQAGVTAFALNVERAAAGAP